MQIPGILGRIDGVSKILVVYEFRMNNAIVYMLGYQEDKCRLVYFLDVGLVDPSNIR